MQGVLQILNNNSYQRLPSKRQWHFLFKYHPWCYRTHQFIADRL